MLFSSALQIRPGITAIIGSGGKTGLLYRLAQELGPRVILCTSTQIYPPTHVPVVEWVESCDRPVCVGSPNPNGKLGSPKQSFSELARLGEYVLVEADGSKHLPLKAHAVHEPVIPEGSNQVITVVGASGLGQSIYDSVHRPEIFLKLTGSEIASPKAVAEALGKEALGTRILINQVDAAPEAAFALSRLLSGPVLLASVQKGEIICSY